MTSINDSIVKYILGYGENGKAVDYDPEGLYEIIKCLTPNQINCIIKLTEGKTPEQIAAETGKPISSIKDLIERIDAKVKTERVKELVLYGNMIGITKDTLLLHTDLNPKIANALWRSNIKTVDDVLNSDEKRIKSVRNFGPKCYVELMTWLKSNGFEYGSPLTVDQSYVVTVRIPRSAVNKGQKSFMFKYDIETEEATVVECKCHSHK